jgi:hypothetical protein
LRLIVADLGVRLLLFVGPTVPVPAPFAVADALVSAEVTDNDRERDGFQLTFRVGRDSSVDYSLLASGILDPPARVAMTIVVNGIPSTLIDGLITNQQLSPSNKPGEATLHVTGEDISLAMDLEEKNATFPNQSDSTIAGQIIGAYTAQYGIVPQVTSTDDTPSETQRTPSQQGTDLAHLRALAKKNGFIFYVETLSPGVSRGYWGPDNRSGDPQPALTMNMGSSTNVDTPISFQYNALGPVAPQVSFVEPTTGVRVTLPVPSSLHPPLSLRPAVAMRKSIPRDVANLTAAQAALKAIASTTQSSDAITASGEVETVRYGRVLQSGLTVGVRGVGLTFDGLYYVQRVTHNIKRGDYKQSFSLSRDGRTALAPIVKV